MGVKVRSSKYGCVDLIWVSIDSLVVLLLCRCWVTFASTISLCLQRGRLGRLFEKEQSYSRDQGT